MMIGVASCGGGDDSATPSSAATIPLLESATTNDVSGSAPSETSELSATVSAAVGAETSAPSDTADAGAIEAMRALFAGVGEDDPGCTVAVGRDGAVVYAEAFGAARLDPTEPMTTETIVDIGSTSKQFTATAILLLGERGRVELDHTLAEYLPNLPDWAGTVTLRQMMHHTAGIPDYIDLLTDAGFEMTGSSTDADALSVLGAVASLDLEPGSRWEYSNSNYFLLGQVVLAVTGAPLGEFLRTEVFEPLGLAMVMDPAAQLPGKATSYEGTGADRSVADSRWEQLGDGGIQTTPSELVKWATQYWAPTVGDAGITAARLDDAVDIGDPDDPGARYGAGIEIDHAEGIGTTLSHSGGWAGFATAFLVVPDRRLVVTATCTSEETLDQIGLTDDEQLLTPWIGEV